MLTAFSITPQKARLFKTREECEEKLAELIKTMKAEIAEMKKAAKNAQQRGLTKSIVSPQNCVAESKEIFIIFQPEDLLKSPLFYQAVHSLQEQPQEHPCLYGQLLRQVAP